MKKKQSIPTWAWLVALGALLSSKSKQEQGNENAKKALEDIKAGKQISKDDPLVLKEAPPDWKEYKDTLISTLDDAIKDKLLKSQSLNAKVADYLRKLRTGPENDWIYYRDLALDFINNMTAEERLEIDKL